MDYQSLLNSLLNFFIINIMFDIKIIFGVIRGLVIEILRIVFFVYNEVKLEIKQ